MHQNTAAFIWSVADDILRNTFKANEYGEVILPFVLLRRLDCVYEPFVDTVADFSEGAGAKIREPEAFYSALKARTDGLPFANSSRFTFSRLVDDPKNIRRNFETWLHGFSPDVAEILNAYQLDPIVRKLEREDLLFMMIERFSTIDLHPSVISNHEMGSIFEELLRRFSEMSNETAGEHYTPREVVRLMVSLLFAEHDDELEGKGLVRSVYDPACGTGGMLTIARDHILEVNPDVSVQLFGQEINDKTWAIAKSDFLLTGGDPERIKLGSSLTNDLHPDQRFDYVLSNPPYGVSWKKEKAAIEAEAAQPNGRYSVGTPRVSDGALLFLQHMVSKMNRDHRSRIAVIFNGSPLFTGDAGSGESEIRRWILENDMLEAIVALPTDLFFNTGIATYIWVLTNRKADRRRGMVQLIDATEFYRKMKKSLGSKRNELSDEHIRQVVDLFTGMKEGENVKIFPTTTFGFRKVQVDRPLRLRFTMNEEGFARLAEERAFAKLAESRKKKEELKRAEEEEGRRKQEEITAALREFDYGTYWTDREVFRADLKGVCKKSGIKLPASIQKAIESAFGVRDEEAAVCLDAKGNPEYDSDLRDHETIPLDQELDSYIKEEVLPYVPDAWVNTDYRDDRDGEVGRVGYEINFNRYFYTYTPPRDLEEIEGELKELEREIAGLLGEVVG